MYSTREGIGTKMERNRDRGGGGGWAVEKRWIKFEAFVWVPFYGV